MTLQRARVGLLVPDPQLVVQWIGMADGNQSAEFVLPVTTDAGSFSSESIGLALVNAAGDYIRIKAIGAGTLWLAENDVTFAAADTLTIYNIRLPFPRYQRVTAAGVVYKDYDIAFPADYRDVLPPAACVTPEVAWVSLNEEIDFDAGDSLAMAHGSAALTVTWSVGAWGTVISTSSGTITNQYTTIKFTQVGSWYVRASVADNVTGAVSVRSVLVFVGDDYTEVLSFERAWSLERGWSASGTVDGVLSYVQHSPAALVDIDSREILMFGFLRPDSMSATFEQQTLSFTLLSPLADSELLTVYPFLVEEVAVAVTPTDWHELEEPTLERVLWFLLFWHSMLPEVANAVYTAPASRRLKGQKFSGGNLPQLLRVLIAASKRVLREAPTGALNIAVHPLFADDGDWGTNPAYPVLALSDTERELGYDLQLATPKFADCLLEGVYLDSGGTYQPARIRAPGAPANWGGSTQKVSQLAPISEAEITHWAERHFVAENRSARLSLKPLVRINPISATLLQTAIAGATMIALEDMRESFNVEGLFWTAQASGRVYASAVSSSVVPPAPEIVIAPTPVPSPAPPLAIIPDGPDESDWPAILFFASKNRGVYVTDNFSSNSVQPVWVAINNISGGGSLDGIDIGYFYVSQTTGTQFVITPSRYSLSATMYRRTNGDWVSALTSAGVIAATAGAYDPAPAGATIWWILESEGLLYVACTITGGGAQNNISILISSDDGVTFGCCDAPTTVNAALGYPGSMIYDSTHHVLSAFRIGTGGSVRQLWDTINYRVDAYVGTQYIFTYYNTDPLGLQMYSTKENGRLRWVNFDQTHGGVGANVDHLVGVETWPKMQFDGQAAYLLGGRNGIYENHLLESVTKWDTLIDRTPSGLGVVVDLLKQSPLRKDFLAMARYDSGTALTPCCLYITEDLGATPPQVRAGDDPQNSSTTISIPFDCGGVTLNGIHFLSNEELYD